MKFYNRAGEIFDFIDMSENPTIAVCRCCDNGKLDKCTHALRNQTTERLHFVCGPEHLKQLVIAMKLHNFVEPT